MKILKKYLWLILILFSVIGIIYPAVGVVAIVCMLAPIVTAPFMGRRWCGHFCPRGSLNDVVLKKLTLNRGIHNIVKTKNFKIGFLMVLMGLFALQIWLSWGDVTAIGAVFVRMILITTIIDIIIGVLFHQRMWCSFCPMGTMAGWVAKVRYSFQR